MNFEDFCIIFEEIFYSNYSLQKRYNYSTMIRDKPNNSFKFSESFISFESYMNDTISITVYQDHILTKKKTLVNKSMERRDDDEEAAPKKEFIKASLLPVRIVLGRKSLVGERRKTNPTVKKKMKTDQISILQSLKKKKEELEVEQYKKMILNSQENEKQGDGFRKTRNKKIVTVMGKPIEMKEEVQQLANQRTRQLKLKIGSDDEEEDINIENALNAEGIDTDTDEEDEQGMGLKKNSEIVKVYKKKTPFDSDIEGLRVSESEIKYVCGKGQDNSTTIQIE